MKHPKPEDLLVAVPNSYFTREEINDLISLIETSPYINMERANYWYDVREKLRELSRQVACLFTDD